MQSSQNQFSVDGKRVWIAGHGGMVGSALVRRLERENCEILTVGRNQLDLRDQRDVRNWVQENRPDAVILAAATVGGILANDSRPVDFLSDNLLIQTNVINAAAEADVAKLLFLGSSCIYPKLAEQPMAEDALLTGPLEPTNQWYAIAKIAGIRLCQAWRQQAGKAFISAMPTNLYGPGDLFDEKASHVIPALMLKLHAARKSGTSVTIWGSGTPRREFLHVDDLADALVFLLERYNDDSHINVGVGEDITILDLARLIGDVVGFTGDFVLDQSKPDGTPRKLLDVRRLSALGWTSEIGLRDGLRSTYEWFKENEAEGNLRHGTTSGEIHGG